MKSLSVFSTFVLIVFSSGFNVKRTLNNQQNSTECSFKCLYSGECIDSERECDGQIDCLDGTDETSACKVLRCPHFAYRCKYGACINVDLVCNGMADCADQSDESYSTCRIAKLCSKNEFQCASGQCIKLESKCDGSPDCLDNSDETFQTCSKMKCPPYSFRCGYGACINGDAKCDGIKNCRDGSDENPSQCEYIIFPNVEFPQMQPNSSSSCQLPSYPDSGTWAILSLGQISKKPGDFVPSGTNLYVSCNDKLKLQGSENIICVNGNWNSPLGYCTAEETCSSPPYNATVEVKCYLENEEVSCSQASNNTSIRINCHNSSVQRKCINGMWTPALPHCNDIPNINISINLNIERKGMSIR